MILVTGGTGLLGSHLLHDLTAGGHHVRAIFRARKSIEKVRKVFSYYSEHPDDPFSRIEWMQADLLDFGAMDEALAGIKKVYHAGAVVSFFPQDHRHMLRVNISGTTNLVNLALDRAIEKFLYVSSVATLGRAENDDFSDEETYWKASKKNSVYSTSKYGAEREVWRGMEEGLNAVIVNPSVILGPGFWGDGNSGLFSLVWNGLKYYTRGVNGFVDVRDVSGACISLMESRIARERFILSSENCSYEQIFRWMARYLDKPAPKIHVPPALTGLAWRIEAIRSFLMRTRPEVTREMATTTAQVYTYRNDKIRKYTGMEFIPVEECIKDTCRIFLSDHSTPTPE